jgi:Tol biopolymer transport system component
VAKGKQSLRIRNLESGENWELLPPDPALYWGPRFSPNSQSLFYVTKQPGSTINVLYRVPVYGGPPEKVVVNIDDPPALSPDGMQIAFVRGYPGQHRDALIVANVDGSAEREILSRQHPDKLSFSGCAWSPDGKLVAAGASRRDETELAVLGVPVNGGPAIEITPWQWIAVRGAIWENDGHTLLFSAQSIGTDAVQLWRVSYPEKVITPVTNDDRQYEEITLGQNALITTAGYEVANLWSSDQSGRSHLLTTNGLNGTSGLAITASGRIVYTVGDYQRSQLWIMNLDGSDRKLLTQNSGVLPSTSRDGRQIAYVSAAGGAHHIWLVDIDGQNNRQLTFGDGENNPSLTPHGDSVVYVTQAKNRGTLWRIPITGGQPVQMTFGGIVRNPVVSPDGTKIACTYRMDEADRWKIAILPFQGGRPLNTFAMPYPFYQIIRWTPDSKALTYLDKVNGVQNVWRQPLDGSPASKITDFNEDLILYYSLPPSRQLLILSRGGRKRDVVLIRNFK